MNLEKNMEWVIPDIGNQDENTVIEIMVKPGQWVKKNESLITLESSKAAMEIPAPQEGEVVEVKVNLGDKIKQGDVFIIINPIAKESSVGEIEKNSSETMKESETNRKDVKESLKEDVIQNTKDQNNNQSQPPTQNHKETVQSDMEEGGWKVHASPSIRQAARQWGIDIVKVKATGPKNRILMEDLKTHVKALQQKANSPQPAVVVSANESGGLKLVDWPQVNFEKWGSIERKPLSRIQKMSAANLHRNWVQIPHVTNHEEADITDLELFRIESNEWLAKNKEDVKLTLLAFLMKACALTLKKFPTFNASLDGQELVLKSYINIGFAADTPSGLVVPVIHQVDQKSIKQLAKEASDLAAKARAGQLSLADMSGGCFTISSLGGIGGTGFTPIINAPEVAILGVSKSSIKPVWNGKEFIPRTVVPLSLSYDHRVIDGALAAKFNAHLAWLLADIRRHLI